LPWSETEFENPVDPGTTTNGNLILEWEDADYLYPGYDDWFVVEDMGLTISGDATQVWMWNVGQKIGASTSIPSTIVSVHLIGDGNDGEAQVYVDGVWRATLDMCTTTSDTAWIIVRDLTLGTHSIEVWATGQTGCSDPTVATFGAAAIQAACSVAPMSIDFDTVAVGISKDTTFSITNTGDGTLSGTVSETCVYYSIVSGGGSYNLSPGQSKVVTVRFSPAFEGTHVCTIETGSVLCGDVSCTGIGFLEGPVQRYYWYWRDIDQFQDNFSTDSTTTGTARIDMAQDILPIANPAILPGDSAVITVSDPVNGLAGDVTTGWGPAVYCYVDDGPVPLYLYNEGVGSAGHIPTAIQSPETRNGNLRWPYVADVVIGSDTWHQFRMDTCFTSGGEPVPHRYCIDLNDNLFVPGDAIYFFYGAENTLGETEYLSAHEFRNGPFTTDDINIAASLADECTILPSAGLIEGNDILYVDGMNFNDAQWAYDWSFQSMNMYDKVDRFDIRGPGSAAVGNHPASRVSNAIVQLSGVYRKIIWNCGDLQTEFGDGSGVPDKSDDTGMLMAFLDNLPDTGGELRSGGVYLDGDDVATVWAQFTSASAIALRAYYLTYAVTNPDHVAAGLGVWPWVVGTDAGLMALTDTLLAYGDGSLISDFDVLAPTGAAVLEANYVSNTGAPTTGGAIVSQTTANPGGALVGFALSGFSFHHIRDLDHDGVADRWEHLEDILLWLNNYPDPPVSTGPDRLRNSLAQNYPNPFNPTTTIEYTIKEQTHVSLKIYNVAGQLVKTLVDEVKSPETVTPLTWDGRNDAGKKVASGVYFCRLVTKDFAQTKKLVLLK
jgi:hypothetical protein